MTVQSCTWAPGAPLGIVVAADVLPNQTGLTAIVNGDVLSFIDDEDGFKGGRSDGSESVGNEEYSSLKRCMFSFLSQLKV